MWHLSGMAKAKKNVAAVTTKRKHVAKKGHWRVHGLKYPSDFEGKPFRPHGKETWKDGWFWIHRGDCIVLYVRVHRLGAARALCRLLNRGATK